MYAALDDSIIRKNGLYVYAHGLVFEDGLPQTLMFVGSKADIYGNEGSLAEFLQKFLEDSILIACPHYRIYPGLQEYIGIEALDLPRRERLLFNEAHNLARSEARRYIYKQL